LTSISTLSRSANAGAQVREGEWLLEIGDQQPLVA
jgi:hypothetical protein